MGEYANVLSKFLTNLGSKCNIFLPNIWCKGGSKMLLHSMAEFLFPCEFPTETPCNDDGWCENGIFIAKFCSNSNHNWPFTCRNSVVKFQRCENAIFEQNNGMEGPNQQFACSKIGTIGPYDIQSFPKTMVPHKQLFEESNSMVNSPRQNPKVRGRGHRHGKFDIGQVQGRTSVQIDVHQRQFYGKLVQNMQG